MKTLSVSSISPHNFERGLRMMGSFMTDEDVRSILIRERGLGPWSADYFLVRGLSRPDAVPAGDLGIRTVVGRHLGDGMRLTPEEALKKLLPFKPYRGLAAFYLLAYDVILKQPKTRRSL